MNTQLTFKSHTLTPIIVNNQPYLGVSQIATALQYGQRVGQNDTPFGERAIRKLYERHADEFTPDMSFLTTVDTNGGKQQVRVFSLRGCHLLAMFSKTPVAKEFRRWVLDLIEQHNQSAPALDAKAIGGIVKRCAVVAVRDEIQATIREEVRNTAINIILAAEKFKPLQEVTDDMLLRCLYNWYGTRHHKLLDTVRELDEENGRLKSKLETIKKMVN